MSCYVHLGTLHWYILGMILGVASHFAGTILKTLSMMQKQELKDLAAGRFSELPVFFLPLGLSTSFVTGIWNCTFSVDPDPDRIPLTWLCLFLALKSRKSTLMRLRKGEWRRSSEVFLKEFQSVLYWTDVTSLASDLMILFRVSKPC